MKFLAVLFSSLLCLCFAGAADGVTDISLLDGSRLKGRIVSMTASEVTVMSDLGTFRVPLDKLTAESRLAVSQAGKPDAEALLRRIAELEAKVSQLQQENEALRRQAASVPVPGYAGPAARSLTPSAPSSPPPAVAAGSHSISSTGKRHNSGCRYFGSGRSCGPNEGIACKICGG